MARTASMTKDEAEAILGGRENFIATSANRPTLRKWLTAQGWKSVDANAQSNVQLTNLYHQYGPEGTAAGLVTTITDTVPMPAAPVATAAPAALPAAPDEQAAALAALIRALAGGSAILDADAVRSIVAPMIEAAVDAIEPTAVVTRLEVTTPAGVNVVPGVLHEITPTVITVAGMAHDVMLVGPAGSGKTTIGNNVATALGLPFFITSTVFDTHELMGFVDGMGKYHSTAFRYAFEHGGVWIADEIDAWDAAALLAANSALANGYATFPDSELPIMRHPNFRVIAAANTFGHGADRVYVGRNQLDAASLDRFAVIDMDYDTNIERFAANGNEAWFDRVREIRGAVRALNIRHVVSTRAIVKGAQALAAGLDRRTVEKLYVFKGMSAADRAKIG